MKAWAWILIGMAVVGIVLFYAGLMKVASRCSQKEEAYYRLHPPDRKSGTGDQTDYDSSADRCVCCGEIIPEGTQVCSNCNGRTDKPDAWW